MSLEIQPHKFHPVAFEIRYDKSNNQIFHLIINILSNRKYVEKIHIIPSWVEVINEKVVNQLMIQNMHGTLAIEGNPLTESEIKKVISVENEQEIKERKDIEATNIKQLYSYINDFKKTENKSFYKTSRLKIKTLKNKPNIFPFFSLLKTNGEKKWAE